MAKHTEINKSLEVEGYTWEGVYAVNRYAIDANNPPKTMKDAKRIAGDFESLTSAKIVTVKTVTERTVKETPIE